MQLSMKSPPVLLLTMTLLGVAGFAVAHVISKRRRKRG